MKVKFELTHEQSLEVLDLVLKAIRSRMYMNKEYNAGHDVDLLKAIAWDILHYKEDAFNELVDDFINKI